MGFSIEEIIGNGQKQKKLNQFDKQSINSTWTGKAPSLLSLDANKRAYFNKFSEIHQNFPSNPSEQTDPQTSLSQNSLKLSFPLPENSSTIKQVFDLISQYRLQNCNQNNNNNQPHLSLQESGFPHLNAIKPFSNNYNLNVESNMSEFGNTSNAQRDFPWRTNPIVPPQQFSPISEGIFGELNFIDYLFSVHFSLCMEKMALDSLKLKICYFKRSEVNHY